MATGSSAHVAQCCIVLLLGALAPAAAQASEVAARAGDVMASGALGPVEASKPSTFGSHEAFADYGYLVVDNRVSLTTSSLDNGNPTAAEFTDDLSIDAPGLTGTQGTATVELRILGGPTYAQAASGPGIPQALNTGYTLSMSQSGSTILLDDGSITYNFGSVPPVAFNGTVPAAGAISLDITFNFGIPFEISAFLSGRAGASNFFSPPSTASISGTTDVELIWDGISSIRDFNGLEVSGTSTVSSTSGTDWTQPQGPPPVVPAVPIGPWVGVAAGLGIAGWAGRLARVRR